MSDSLDNGRKPAASPAGRRSNLVEGRRKLLGAAFPGVAVAGGQRLQPCAKLIEKTINRTRVAGGLARHRLDYREEIFRTVRQLA